MEVELVVPPIIYKEGDEVMATNLRVGFKERQRKCLFESITIIPPHAKKPCTKILYPKPVLVIALVPNPLATTASVNPLLDGRLSSTGGAVHLELGGPSTSPTQLDDDSVECVAFVLPRF